MCCGIRRNRSAGIERQAEWMRVRKWNESRANVEINCFDSHLNWWTNINGKRNQFHIWNYFSSSFLFRHFGNSGCGVWGVDADGGGQTNNSSSVQQQHPSADIFRLYTECDVCTNDNDNRHRARTPRIIAEKDIESVRVASRIERDNLMSSKHGKRKLQFTLDVFVACMDRNKW